MKPNQIKYKYIFLHTIAIRGKLFYCGKATYLELNNLILFLCVKTDFYDFYTQELRFKFKFKLLPIPLVCVYYFKEIVSTFYLVPSFLIQFPIPFLSQICWEKGWEIE